MALERNSGREVVITERAVKGGVCLHLVAAGGGGGGMLREAL